MLLIIQLELLFSQNSNLLKSQLSFNIWDLDGALVWLLLWTTLALMVILPTHYLFTIWVAITNMRMQSAQSEAFWNAMIVIDLSLFTVLEASLSSWEFTKLIIASPWTVLMKPLRSLELKAFWTNIDKTFLEFNYQVRLTSLISWTKWWLLLNKENTCQSTTFFWFLLMERFMIWNRPNRSLLKVLSILYQSSLSELAKKNSN